MNGIEFPNVLIVSGPTGVGKSDFISALAGFLPVEVINCDIGSFYKPTTIGTAKPDWRSEKAPHHRFDFLEKPVEYSVAAYRDDIRRLVNEICQRGNVPVIVGGSLFYIQSLFFPPFSLSEQGQEKIEWTVPEWLRVLSNEKVWEHLNSIDPSRAGQIEPNDRYRVERALSIWYGHGVKPSMRKPHFDPLFSFFFIFLTRERARLYERINERVLQMFHQGWVREVAQLDVSWRNFVEKKGLIGYPEIVQCLQVDSVEQCERNKKLIQVIQKKTRHYAKRQITFWRMLQKKLDVCVRDYRLLHQDFYGSCSELNLTLSSVDLYIDHIIAHFRKTRHVIGSK